MPAGRSHTSRVAGSSDLLSQLIGYFNMLKKYVTICIDLAKVKCFSILYLSHGQILHYKIRVEYMFGSTSRAPAVLHSKIVEFLKGNDDDMSWVAKL